MTIDNKINILHIITGLPMAGAEISLYNLLAGMDGQCFKSTVISLMNIDAVGERIQKLGIPVYAIGMPRGRPTPRTLLRFIHLVRALGPWDLVQGWEYHGSFAATMIGELIYKSTPVIWGIHHTPYNLKDERLLTATLIRLGGLLSITTTIIIYVSKSSRIRHESLGYRADRGIVIPNGFDLAQFRPLPDARASVRAELGIPQETLLLGLIARFHPVKDHDNFLNAAAIIAQKRSDVHFLLAGDKIDENNPMIMDLVKNKAIENRVHLLGERLDVPRLLAALDIATVSSWGEACPMVIGEAMACGVPCVVTDVGDSAWLVGDTGYVVPPRDSIALARAWKKMLSLSPKERTYLGAKARQRIAQNFTLEAMVRRYEQLYGEATQN